jgi:hypothetical protein
VLHCEVFGDLPNYGEAHAGGADTDQTDKDYEGDSGPLAAAGLTELAEEEEWEEEYFVMSVEDVQTKEDEDSLVRSETICITVTPMKYGFV